MVSECDGCRVMGTHKIELVQRVPQSVESIFSIGSYDPPALLLFALEKYEKGDVCAQDRASLINYSHCMTSNEFDAGILETHQGQVGRCSF